MFIYPALYNQIYIGVRANLMQSLSFAFSARLTANERSGKNRMPQLLRSVIIRSYLLNHSVHCDHLYRGKSKSVAQLQFCCGGSEAGGGMNIA
jgi:hypothetical protein